LPGARALGALPALEEYGNENQDDRHDRDIGREARIALTKSAGVFEVRQGRAYYDGGRDTGPKPKRGADDEHRENLQIRELNRRQ
jgi:hypothetical protein